MRHALIVGSDSQPAALVVDRILGLREIVIHPVADPLIAVPGIAGATELANGRVSLILDAAALIRGARDHGVRSKPPTLRDASTDAPRALAPST